LGAVSSLAPSCLSLSAFCLSFFALPHAPCYNVQPCVKPTAMEPVNRGLKPCTKINLTSFVFLIFFLQQEKDSTKIGAISVHWSDFPPLTHFCYGPPVYSLDVLIYDYLCSWSIKVVTTSFSLENSSKIT
jgi:hypothetical protein